MHAGKYHCVMLTKQFSCFHSQFLYAAPELVVCILTEMTSRAIFLSSSNKILIFRQVVLNSIPCCSEEPERRRKSRQSVCVCVCMFNTNWLNSQGKSSHPLFEAGSISVLRKHTEERAAGCVWMKGKNKAGGRDETINNVFITEVPLLSHPPFILPLQVSVPFTTWSLRSRMMGPGVSNPHKFDRVSL